MDREKDIKDKDKRKQSWFSSWKQKRKTKGEKEDGDRDSKINERDSKIDRESKMTFDPSLDENKNEKKYESVKIHDRKSTENKKKRMSVTFTDSLKELFKKSSENKDDKDSPNSRNSTNNIKDEPVKRKTIIIEKEEKNKNQLFPKNMLKEIESIKEMEMIIGNKHTKLGGNNHEWTIFVTPVYRNQKIIATSIIKSVTLTLPEEYEPMHKITITKAPFQYTRVTTKPIPIKVELNTFTDGIVDLEYKISFKRDGEQESYLLSKGNIRKKNEKEGSHSQVQHNVVPTLNLKKIDENVDEKEKIRQEIRLQIEREEVEQIRNFTKQSLLKGGAMNKIRQEVRNGLMEQLQEEEKKKFQEYLLNKQKSSLGDTFGPSKLPPLPPYHAPVPPKEINLSLNLSDLQSKQRIDIDKMLENIVTEGEKKYGPTPRLRTDTTTGKFDSALSNLEKILQTGDIDQKRRTPSILIKQTPPSEPKVGIYDSSNIMLVASNNFFRKDPSPRVEITPQIPPKIEEKQTPSDNEAVSLHELKLDTSLDMQHAIPQNELPKEVTTNEVQPNETKQESVSETPQETPQETLESLFDNLQVKATKVETTEIVEVKVETKVDHEKENALSQIVDLMSEIQKMKEDQAKKDLEYQQKDSDFEEITMRERNLREEITELQLAAKQTLIEFKESETKYDLLEKNLYILGLEINDLNLKIKDLTTNNSKLETSLKETQEKLEEATSKQNDTEEKLKTSLQNEILLKEKLKQLENKIVSEKEVISQNAPEKESSFHIPTDSLASRIDYPSLLQYYDPETMVEESQASLYLKKQLTNPEILSEMIRTISNPKKSEFTKYHINNNEIVFKMIYIVNSLLKDFESDTIKNQILDLFFSENLISIFFEIFSEENISLKNKTLEELQCSYFKDFVIDTLIPKRRRELIEYIGTKNQDEIYPARLLFKFIHNQHISLVITSLLNTEVESPKIMWSENVEFMDVLLESLFIGRTNSGLSEIDREKAAENSSNILKKIVQSMNHNHLNDKLIFDVEKLFAASFGCFSSSESKPDYFHKLSFVNVLELFTDLVVITFGGFRDIPEEVLSKAKRLLIEHIGISKTFLEAPPMEIYYSSSSKLIPKMVGSSHTNPESLNGSKKCFGEIRKAIINFVAGLLNAGDEDIENALIEMEIFEKVMDLFFEFKNVNIIAATIMQLIIVPVFEDGIDTIKDVLIEKYGLLDKIIENFKDPLDEKNNWNTIYLNNGFLTQISILFNGQGIGSENEAWSKFVEEKIQKVIDLQDKKDKLPERAMITDKNGNLNFSRINVDVENTSITFETN